MCCFLEPSLCIYVELFWLFDYCFLWIVIEVVKTYTVTVTSDFCRLATSLLKYTCSIIVGIYLVIYLSSLLSALGSIAVRYYNMLVGVAHGLLKLKIWILKFERGFPRKPKKPPWIRHWYWLIRMQQFFVIMAHRAIPIIGFLGVRCTHVCL